MIELSKKVNLYWTKNTNAFSAANKDLQIEETRILGSAKSAVTDMLAKGAEQRAIMRNVIGVDPNSQTSNWDSLIKNYWDSLSVIIPSSGRILEVGFKYDIKTQDDLRKDAIRALKADKKDITTSEKLSIYAEGLEEEYKYRFGEPLVPEDYMLWRYCLVYGYVANSIDEIKKAPKKIKFYLFSETERKDEQKAKHELKKDLTIKYLEVIKDKELMDSILMVNGFAETINDMSVIDKEQAIDGLTLQSPNKFLASYKDKTIKTKSIIEQLVVANILRRLPNTDKIVDAKDVTINIGDSLDEAVGYFLNQKNKAIVSEYTEIYKHNKKK